ncbi:hypothetical protein PQR02_37020 [Paraburkholderia sediminicola]|uniref:Uncharacterized protein n=1 Tax=Paraburkholderia rhynchosiae TaxID=487049 RepID=A0ACC7NP36_9BURK
MEFDYTDFHIDVTPLVEGGQCFARATLLRTSPDAEHRTEEKWSGDLGQFPSERAALDYASSWAIDWCDANGG